MTKKWPLLNIFKDIKKITTEIPLYTGVDAIDNFKVDALASYLAANYEENKWKAQIQGDIAENQGVAATAEFIEHSSVYFAGIVIAAFNLLQQGGLINQKTSESTFNSLSVILAMTMMLIKAFCDPTEAAAANANIRLNALLKYGQMHHLPCDETWVDRGRSNQRSITNVVNAIDGAAIPKSTDQVNDRLQQV